MISTLLTSVPVRRSLWRELALVPLVFFFIYGVQFTFLPTFTARIIALLSVCWLSVYLLLANRVSASSGILFVLGAYVSYLVYVAILTLVFAARDTSLLANAVLMFVQVFVGAAFIAWLARNEADPCDCIISAVQMAISVQALFVVLYFLSAEFRQFVLTYLPETSNVGFQSQLRSRGLTNGGGATLSVVQGIGLLCSVFLLARRNGKLRLLYLLCSSSLLFVSILLSGRTGLLILPFVFVLMVKYVVTYQRVPRGWAIAAIAGPFLLVAAWIGLRAIFYILVGDTEAEEGFERLMRWVLEGFFRDGLLGSRTVDVLLSEHWHFPENLTRLFFGDPQTWDLRRVHSDIGFIRRLYGTGIVGATLGYAAMLIMCWNINALRSTPVRRYFLFILISWLFFIDLKEPFSLKFEILSIVSLLYFASYWFCARQNVVYRSLIGRRLQRYRMLRDDEVLLPRHV